MTDPIRSVDLVSQRTRLGPEVDDAILAVLEHGAFVSGPEIGTLEDRLRTITGAGHVVSCASGTDALIMALMALGVKPGDYVCVPAFTFAATAGAVALLGAEPVFIDVDPSTFNTEPEQIDELLSACAVLDRQPVGIILVDLFGTPADVKQIEGIAANLGMWTMVDAAQSFGGSRNDVPVGNLARVTTTSFYPAKPLGCYGDGGAIFSNDDVIAASLRSIREHGRGGDRYEHAQVGLTGRLDTIQAAVLLQKLRIFESECVARDRIALRYSDELKDCVLVPARVDNTRSVWAQFTIQIEDRDVVADDLMRAGIPVAIHYPKALPDQPAYRRFRDPTGSQNARALANRVLSLPIHPYLTDDQQGRVISAVRAVAKKGPTPSGY